MMLNYQNSKMSMLPILLFVTVYGCSTGSSHEPEASANREFFVFVAEGLDEETLNEAGNQFQNLIGQIAEPEDVVHLVTTPQHTPVATVEVSRGSANSRLRHPSFRPLIPQIVATFQADGEASSQQVQLPMVASTVRSLRRTDFPCKVILIGSPICDDPRQPGWSMKGGLVPTDGALTAQNSPYHSPHNLPDGTTVSWLVPDSEWGVDQMHRDAVTRFHRLYLRLHRGLLIRMTADAETAFSSEISLFEGDVVARNETPGMRTVTFSSSRAEDAVEPEPIPVPVDPPAPIRPTTQRPEPSVPTTEEVEQLLESTQEDDRFIAIAIHWESDDPRADLDLRIANKGSQKELSFGRMTTSFGQLFRDVQSSGRIVGSGSDFQNWEWAKINHNRGEDVTAWVNVYNAKKPVRVQIITVWNGKRREQTRLMNVFHGDRGKGVPNRSNNENWLKIVL